jgi:hypothetical protein
MKSNQEKIICKCGCGGSLLKYDKRGRERFYQRGHQHRGKNYTYGIKLCACGCGQIIEAKGNRKFADNHPISPVIFCGCGCGKTVTGNWHGQTLKYVKGHNWKGIRRSTYLEDEWVACACGCGQMVNSIVRKKDGRLSHRVRFITGHSHKGARNYFWKGGITDYGELIRLSPEYKQWRKLMYKRDNYTCIICGSNNRIEADHIKSLAEILEVNGIRTIDEARNCSELWDVTNGRVLCHECHTKTENYAGRNRKALRIDKSEI